MGLVGPYEDLGVHAEQMGQALEGFEQGRHD